MKFEESVLMSLGGQKGVNEVAIVMFCVCWYRALLHIEMSFTLAYRFTADHTSVVSCPEE